MRDTIIHITAPYDSDHAPVRAVVSSDDWAADGWAFDIAPITVGFWAHRGQVRVIQAPDDAPKGTIYSAVVPTDHIGHPIWPDGVRPPVVQAPTCDWCGKAYYDCTC